VCSQARRRSAMRGTLECVRLNRQAPRTEHACSAVRPGVATLHNIFTDMFTHAFCVTSLRVGANGRFAVVLSTKPRSLHGPRLAAIFCSQASLHRCSHAHLFDEIPNSDASALRTGAQQPRGQPHVYCSQHWQTRLRAMYAMATVATVQPKRLVSLRADIACRSLHCTAQRALAWSAPGH
jgi:hypothetical protein